MKAWAVLFHFRNKDTTSNLYESFKSTTRRNIAIKAQMASYKFFATKLSEKCIENGLKLRRGSVCKETGWPIDLVITSGTSIAHIAGAMGVPVWVIVPILPYHIWAYGDDHSPWYQNTTKVYRQKIFGEWDDVFARVQDDIIEKFRNQPETAMPVPEFEPPTEIPDIPVPEIQAILNKRAVDDSQ